MLSNIRYVMYEVFHHQDITSTNIFEGCCKVVEIFFIDTFWAPLFSVLMPWRDEDCYTKAYELIQSATPFPWPW